MEVKRVTFTELIALADSSMLPLPPLDKELIFGLISGGQIRGYFVFGRAPKRCDREHSFELKSFGLIDDVASRDGFVLLWEAAQASLYDFCVMPELLEMSPVASQELDLSVAGGHYAWFNPQLTFYTYMITATDSVKYYFGVSHVKKKDASVEDCQLDGYWGSGGAKSKFANWKKKHEGSLQKTILGLFSHRLEAFNAERELVNDKWKTDPLCLNSVAGGSVTGPNVLKLQFREKQCVVHDLTVHNGDSCVKCYIEPLFVKGDCTVHGETNFVGDTCRKCSRFKTVTSKTCGEHGVTKFQGDHCYACLMDGIYSEEECSLHGLVMHRSGKCITCQNLEAVRLAVCDMHGMVKHRGKVCSTCAANDSISMKECSAHGLATFKGETCLNCVANKTISVKDCNVHGLTKFKGNSCFKCANVKAVQLKECTVHGLVKHRGDRCYTCVNRGNV